MRDANDMELVRDYARSHSEAAFAGLVERHLGLVYSAALRQVGMPAQAEEIAQAVFIILARKAGGLRRDTVLEAWLYETTRLTALSFLRTERRRQFREQEAYMESSLQESPSDPVWPQIAPLLDEAMMRLGGGEREAIVLRFFKGQSLREAAAGLAISEAAAQKRVNRALEKLHRFFRRRGISSTTAIIAGEMAANSVQIAPVALAQVVTAAAVAKGAAASTSMATLIKGAMKIMAWTKVKTAVVVGAGVLLATGTTTVTVREILNHRADWSSFSDATVDDSFFLANSRNLFSLPANLLIVRPSHFSSERSALSANRVLFGHQPESRLVCSGALLPDLLSAIYEISPVRVVLPPDAPTGRFDCLATVPAHSREEQLRNAQREIARRLGLVGHREKRDMDVLVLQMKSPNATAFVPHAGNRSSVETKQGKIHLDGQGVGVLGFYVENALQQVVMDHTGLTGFYDYTVDEKAFDKGVSRENIDRILLDQFGLELVPGREPVEMLVVDKVK